MVYDLKLPNPTFFFIEDVSIILRASIGVLSPNDVAAVLMSFEERKSFNPFFFNSLIAARDVAAGKTASIYA